MKNEEVKPLEPVEHKTPFGPILGAEELPIKKPKKK